MAQRTIAPGGGNSNVASTYVENLVPGSGDFIVGDASSGQLTVVANLTVQRVDFTGYLDVLTINNNIQLTLGLVGGTSTFSAAGTYNFIGAGTTQGRIARSSTAMSINMLGTTPIPRFVSNSFSTTGNIITALSDLYFINLQNTGSGLIINGSFDTYVSGDLLSSNLNTMGGTQPFHMIGTGDYRGRIGLSNFPATLNINTLGTITIIDFMGAGGSSVVSGVDATVTINHIAGTIVNPAFMLVPSAVNTTPGSIGITILNLISGTTWDTHISVSLGLANSFNIIEFNGVADFDQFRLIFIDQPVSTQFNIKIQGDTNISCNDFTFSPSYNSTNNGGQKVSIDLLLTPGQSFTVNNSIDINGGTDQPGALQTPPLEIKSTTGGTQANLILNTYNQFVSRVKITDIDCSSGNTLYGQELTLSNTTNITQYTLPPASGGGGESSYVFFS